MPNPPFIPKLQWCPICNSPMVHRRGACANIDLHGEVLETLRAKWREEGPKALNQPPKPNEPQT